MNGLGRLAKLERENIELNEEVLRLKNQLLAVRMAGTPSLPESPASSTELETTVAALRQEVMQAMKELQKYRSVPVAKEEEKKPPAKNGWNNDDFDLDDLLN